MRQGTYKELFGYLEKIGQHSGHFIIEGQGYYCQFYKDFDSTVLFEAVSHYMNERVDSSKIEDFLSLGFSLSKNQNYLKKINLDNSQSVRDVANDVKKIFENLYLVSDEHDVIFDDQIELKSETKATKKVNVKADSVTQAQKNTSSSSFQKWLIAGVIALVLYYVVSDDSTSKNKKEKVVYNSEWDASVYQVTDYIKHNYLKDPDSYQSISWSEVIKLNDTKENGVASFRVRHKYRAKNSYGGYVVEEKLFDLDYNGKVVEINDYGFE